MRIPISAIEVPADRQRKDLGDIAALSASIARWGLLNPIIVEQTSDTSWRLVAGERRLRATMALGQPEILARPLFSLSLSDREALELEENIKRKDLAWQEQVRAIARFHSIHKAAEPSWTLAQTAQELSFSENSIKVQILVAEKLDSTPMLQEATGWDAAYRMLTRSLDRALSSMVDFDLGLTEESEEPASETPSAPPAPLPPPSTFSILQADFTTWAQTYSGPPFNFLHCDFPYGLNMGEERLQRTAKDRPRYDDSEDLYWRLCEQLFEVWAKKLIAPSAHVMFWLSPKFLLETRECILTGLQENGFEDVVIDPFPLIWHKSDGRGLLPDPRRGPRRVYETALHISIGDRPIVRPVANAVSLPTEKFSALHLSEKPIAVLDHFFRLYVDENSRVLDPTCGAGSAIFAAQAAGAESGLGIELDPEAAQLALSRLNGAS